MSLGETIRLTRKKVLLTQEDFARKLSVSPATVIRWEQDKSHPGIKAMKALKDFCGEYNVQYEPLEKEWLELQQQND